MARPRLEMLKVYYDRVSACMANNRPFHERPADEANAYLSPDSRAIRRYGKIVNLILKLMRVSERCRGIINDCSTEAICGHHVSRKTIESPRIVSPQKQLG